MAPRTLISAAVLLACAAGASAQGLSAGGGPSYEISVLSYAALGNGSTDDTAAINTAIAAFNAATVAGSCATLRFAPRHAFVVATPGGLNFTGIKGVNYCSVIDMTGASIICKNGSVCGDGTGADHLTWIHPTWIGSGTGAAESTYGFLQARVSLQADCGRNEFDHHTTAGSFSIAATYSGACETQAWFSPNFGNSDTGNSYALALDQTNHFNPTSAYVTRSQVVDQVGASYSFNENSFYSPQVVGSGSACPLWMNGTERHRWRGGYELALGSPYGVCMYDTGAGPERDLVFDVHVEGTALTNIFNFEGPNATPVVYGLAYRDHGPQQTGGIFSLASGVTSMTLQNVDIAVQALQHTGATWFDNTANYAVSGQVWSGDSSYPASAVPVSGRLCQGASCNSTSVLPSVIQASTFGNTGAVNSITVTGNSGFIPTASGIQAFPSITIGAPTVAGGSQAAAHVRSLSLTSYPTINSGGQNYTSADVGKTVSASGGFSCTPANFVTITAVTSGVVTGISGNGTPQCSVIPSNVAPTSGSTAGSGLTLNIPQLRVGIVSTSSSLSDVVLDSGGGGYVAPPPVTFSGGTPSASAGGGYPTATTTINSVSQFVAGNGSVVANSAGTTLGLAGTSGAPVFSAGALIDASGVRVALGAAYTVPANTSLVRLTGTATVASATITLPTALADGQAVQFVNEGETVTALTFSPAVTGWTAGSQLAPTTYGLRVRWDATSAAWYREQ